MALIAKIFRILFRLTLPGGVLIVLVAVLARVGVLDDDASPFVRFFPAVVFLSGLVLAGVFRRSRLFFALLALGLSQTALAWILPHLPSSASHVLSNEIALLLPLNLLAFAFLRERGIISPAGRRRLAVAGLQIAAACVFCLPQLAEAAAWLDRQFVPEVLSRWSHLSQPALVSFMLSASVLVALLIQRYRVVESSLLWALLASFIAFRSGVNHLSGFYFATGGAILIVALLETSYRMAYHDELTQLPSRRALNEALLKLPESYAIAMVDVDHFKKFNDTYGHEAGDQALRLVASRLARVAGGGRAYRYGGEEFAVVFPGKASEEVFQFLDGLRKIIEQSAFVVRGKDRRKRKKDGKTRMVTVKKQTNVTVSVGLASTNGNRTTPADILRAADHALYRAKAKGRNCTVTARPGKGTASVKPAMSIVSVS